MNNMTSTGKYKVNTTNLYNRNQAEYTSANNYSTPRRPHRSTSSSQNHNNRKPSYEDVTDGEDEKKLLSLSERIKRLSTSRVLKDNSVLTHNNNEPFTYLRGPQRKSGQSGVNIGAYPKPNVATTSRGTYAQPVRPKGREVIYAQVVVDPEDRKNKQRNKRTVHRSYNNNNYPPPTTSTNALSSTLFNQRKPSNAHPISASNNSRMKGKNVTTVLLNSSSDDIPSSLNMEERIGGFNDSRYRSSSSPLLTTNNDYYPKSPGIVKQHLQNGFSGSRSRYENYTQRHSTDYLHKQSDEDDYYNDIKLGGKYSRERERSPLFPSHGGSRDTDNSDDFYSYQPVNYGGKSASTNFIDGYGYNKSRANYRIDEEDEYDTTRINSKFDEKRSKTLERDSSFKTYRNRTEDFINRSKTLDNRISSLRERSMMLEEQNRRERIGGGDPYSDFNPNKSELDANFTNKMNNSQNAKNSTSSKTKDKHSGSSGNIFSTLLRRNNKKTDTTNKNVTQSKSTSSALNTSSVMNSNINNTNTSTTKPVDANNKKPNSNFFTSFLEKKRIKKQQQLAPDLNKGQAHKGEQQNTYQSFENWPSDPPSLSVIDYSELTPTAKPYYGESNIDTEDTSAHGSDIWKKSYGSDMTKVKRRWTMREPSKPTVIREEEDLTNRSRTLGKKQGYTSSTAINSSSIDRRKNRNSSTDREGSYDPMITKRYNDESDRFLKVPGATTTGGKYNTIDARYSPEKISYSPQKYDEYDGYANNTLTKRGRNTSSDKFSKGYSGGGGFVGTPNSSGSESNNNRMTTNGSLRSVYLHEPAVIPEMPRTLANSGGGGASLSGLSGRRTLSKDEISNYSGSRKETKQLSRSMSMAHPWGPRFIHNEIDYSRNNNPHLPPRPPSRSPSGSLGINPSFRLTPSGSNVKSSSRSPSKSFNSSSRPPLPGRKQPVSSSSVESLLRQDTPDEVIQNKKGNSKLGRSKSMSVSQSREPRDGKGNRFSTLWFNKKNSNK